MICLSLDDISVLIGRLLIAIVVIGAVFLGVHTFAPGWFDNTMQAAMNSLVGTIGTNAAG